MSTTPKTERTDGGPDCYVCDNCRGAYLFANLHDITDRDERVDPGGPEPAGECPVPDCGALCYPAAEEEDVRTLAAQVASDVRDLLQCNCAVGPCDGHCTYSMAGRLLARLQAGGAL